MAGTGAVPGDDELDGLDMRSLLTRLGVGIVVMFCVVVILAMVAEEPLTAFAEGFVSRFGLLGVFVAVVCTDTLLLTHEPVLLAGYVGGLGFFPVFVVASVASIGAGALGWSLGSLLRNVEWLARFFARYRIQPFLERYGFWAVSVAALTPFPFSVATWSSGAAGIPLSTVMLGSLFRIPKVLFYFSIMVFGWDILGT